MIGRLFQLPGIASGKDARTGSPSCKAARPILAKLVSLFPLQFYDEYSAAYPVVLYSPPDVGDNGHWIASKTYEEYFPHVAKYMEVCLEGSVAISFIDYADDYHYY